jgi:hypothetical protein
MCQCGIVGIVFANVQYGAQRSMSGRAASAPQLVSSDESGQSEGWSSGRSGKRFSGHGHSVIEVIPVVYCPDRDQIVNGFRVSRVAVSILHDCAVIAPPGRLPQAALARRRLKAAP